MATHLRGSQSRDHKVLRRGWLSPPEHLTPCPRSRRSDQLACMKKGPLTTAWSRRLPPSVPQSEYPSAAAHAGRVMRTTWPNPKPPTGCDERLERDGDRRV